MNCYEIQVSTTVQEDSALLTSQDKEISQKIVQSISRMLDRDEFKDFTVEVEDVSIRCHSFILASCSEYFQGLLRSDLKESRERLVKLPGINYCTFSLILKMLYTGSDLLTNDNVNDIWCACHRLQVMFLVKHCEDFVVDSLSLATLESAYLTAKLLFSENVLKKIYRFILFNFEAVRKTETFMQLSYTEVHDIVMSSRLVTSSEDLVLYSIYDWIQYENVSIRNDLNIDDDTKSTSTSTNGHVKVLKSSSENDNFISSRKENEEPTCEIIEKSNETPSSSESNNRKLHLSDLLKASRYCLASTSCLTNLYNKELTQNDVEAKDIFFRTSSYLLFGLGHGYWPTASIHRECDGMEHLAVMYGSDGLWAISLKSVKQFQLPKSKAVHFYSYLTVFENKLYAVALLGHTSFGQHYLISVLKNDKWQKVIRFSHGDLGENVFLLAHDKCIYLFSKTSKEIHWFDPKDAKIKLQTFTSEAGYPQYAISHQGNILIFCTVVEEEEEEEEKEEDVEAKITVYCWSPMHDTWSNLGYFDGSLDHLTSFQDETSTYVLESGGNLWKVDADHGTARFTLLNKLWNFENKLRGVALYRNTLLAIGSRMESVEVEWNCEPVFTSLLIGSTSGTKSNFIYFVHPKNSLKELIDE